MELWVDGHHPKVSVFEEIIKFPTKWTLKATKCNFQEKDMDESHPHVFKY